MKLNIGDRVVFRRNNMLHEGNIKSIQGNRIEIDDNSIKLIVASIQNSDNKMPDDAGKKEKNTMAGTPDKSHEATK